jgi:uncharacterized protein (TIGR03435 family)
MNEMTSHKRLWALVMFVAAISTPHMWAQGGNTPPAATAQPPADQQFEVATIKPSSERSGSGSPSGIGTGHGRLNGQNVTLKRCIIGAYGVGPNQVVGGPEWVSSDSFDIQAKADQPIDDDGVLDVMLQNLLADRFKLKLHRETRSLPAFVLEIDKNGPKLEQAPGGDSYTNTGTGKNGSVVINARNTDMDLLVQVLARKLDLPVVNATGLKGAFNFKLQWTPDNAKAGQSDADISIFDALPQQIGLRLRKEKAPVEVLVIDHVEKPSEN